MRAERSGEACAAIPTMEESRMARPMFFHTGVYDNVADAGADYEAIKSLNKDVVYASGQKWSSWRKTPLCRRRASLLRLPLWG
jgi:hypothetical protein